MPDRANKVSNTIDIDMTPPTSAEYVGQATRELLNIMNDVAQQVPIPAFSAAVKIAMRIVKTCEDSRATLDSAEELKYRIQELFRVMVDKLKGKKVEEIHPDLIAEMGNLQMDMANIKKMLDKITSQSRILLSVFPTLNDSKVQKCVTRVNHAIERFNFACNIGNTNTLTRVEEQLEKLVIKSTPSRAPIPANSAIFHGRDSLVAELVGTVTGSSMTKHSPRHICILGPGGMGKTSTSLAVMNHPEVKIHFADHLRVWVPCIKATSVSLFLNTLQSSLAIPQDAGNTRGAIISTLRASPPIVILLDNFETPWDADGAQSEISQLLRDLHNIPHVTLFVTTRSSSPPCDDIPWHHVDLRGVDAAAAREIYAAQYPEGRKDLDLPHLLTVIGHMPLAITLMAKVAKVTHLSAAELMDEYDKLGTSILGQGSDTVSSMDVCIGLSVYSSPMKAHPDAFNLLCVLAMLPTGTSYRMLSKWWASDLPNLPGALDVLKGASLIEERGSTYSVLPVIQRYILDPSRFDCKVRTSMIESACTFLRQHQSMIGDPLYKEHIAAISPEESNLEAVLLQVTIPDPYIIRTGLLLLAHYQQINRPRVDIVEHALKLVQTLDDNLLRGEILYCYGDISETLYHFDKSLKQLQEALDLFRSVHDRKKAAESRLVMSRLLAHHPTGDFDFRQLIIQEARADFEFINDEAGIGRCLSTLGDLHGQYSSYHTALALLKEAEGILARVKDWFSHAECTMYLAFIYYRICQYEVAYSWAASWLEECKCIGDSLGCVSALNILGLTAHACGDFERSLEHYLHCLNMEKSMGLHPSDHVLEALGVTCVRLGKITDAHWAFEEALQQYSQQEPAILSRHVIIRAQFFLKHLKDSQS